MSSEINQPLASLEAEQSVCGALLQVPTEFDAVSELVAPADFYYPITRSVYLAIFSAANAGREIDIFLLTESFPENQRDEMLATLSDLATNVPSASNVAAYARIVRDRAVKRRVLEVGQTIQENVIASEQAPAAEVVEFTQSLVMQLEESQSESLEVSHVDDAMKSVICDIEDRFQSGGALNGISSGFVELDEKLNGYKPGQFVIIAGRPGIGKTTYALQKACNFWVKQELNGLFFSCEMSTDELTEKMLANVGRIPLDFIEKPNSANGETFWPALQAAVMKLKGKNANLIDCPGIHINQLKSFARKAHKRKKLDFLMTDHINIMGGDGKSPTEKVSSITGGLKHIAKELGIPVFGLMQLNRGVEGRPDKRPVISDLRESGSAEQDADIIQLLYREEYYKKDGEGDQPNDGLLEVNVAKLRKGKRGTFCLEALLHQSRFEDTKRQPIYQTKNVKPYRVPA